MAKTFADQIVETLMDHGVTKIFGLVGDSLNPIVDSVRRHKGIEWIHVRNEEAAAFAAGSYSQITGELSVCAGSCGPGNTHLIQGLYDSNRNRAKVLALASHIPSQQIGSDFFQETHPTQIFAEASGYCELVNSPTQGARVLHTAIQHAIGGNQVAVMVLPGDVAAQEADTEVSTLGKVAPASETVVPNQNQINDLASAINNAKKITLFVGSGAQGAHDEIMQFAELIKSPVGHSFGGKEWIQYDNPFEVGMSGLLGYGACYDAMHKADLLILLGTDFPYMEFYPQNCLKAQVDINANNLGRRTKLDFAINGDTKSTLAALTPLIKPKSDRKFLDSMLRKHEKALRNVVSAYTKNNDKLVPIHPEYVASIVDEVAADDAIFTVDTGMCNVWSARYISPGPNRRILGSWRHGTMANALPHAIGAQEADLSRQVVAMCGDGGLSMLLGELLTVKLHNLPIKMVVFNNSSLGMVKLEMLVQGFPEFETDFPNVNYSEIAKAMGIDSIRITDPKTLPNGMREAFAKAGPQLIEVVTNPNALSMPPDITATQIKGFMESSMKTVFMPGGVGNMLNLAKSNLRNIPRP